jgi:hypothetical protein
MNRPAGGPGDLARGASVAVVKGAALIGVAVIIGAFLLGRVGSSNAGSPTTSAKGPKTTTTTTYRSSSTTTAPTTTTVQAAPAKTPAQLRLLVLNGGAATGQAGSMRTKLEQVGYTNQPQASTWTGHHQTGTTIMCRANEQAAAVALSQQTPLKAAQVVPFASNLPSSVTSDVDCVVVVGA